MFALFVNIDIARSSCIVLSSCLLVWLVLLTAHNLNSVWPKISPTRFFNFTNSLHTLISSTPSSIPSTDTPDLHFKGPSLSFFNFKNASRPVFQTGKELLKHLYNYSLPLLKSSLCYVASTQPDIALRFWQPPCLPLLQKSVSCFLSMPTYVC